MIFLGVRFLAETMSSDIIQADLETSAQSLGQHCNHLARLFVKDTVDSNCLSTCINVLISNLDIVPDESCPIDLHEALKENELLATILGWLRRTVSLYVLGNMIKVSYTNFSDNCARHLILDQIKDHFAVINGSSCTVAPRSEAVLLWVSSQLEMQL